MTANKAVQSSSAMRGGRTDLTSIAPTMTDEHAMAARRNIRFVLVEPDHLGNIGGVARALEVAK